MRCDELRAVRRAIEGLVYPSESDVGFDVVRWGKAAGSAKDQVIAHAGGSGEVEELPVDEFFAQLEGTDDAERFRQLRAALEHWLTGLSVFRAGRVRVEVYVVGRTRGGEWAGVHTTSVET